MWTSKLAAARSLLFVPGDRPERFAKAADSGAHAVILDLEDAVRMDDKARARAACHAYLERGGTGLVRVNATDTPWIDEDLALCGHPGVAAVVVPKAETPEQLDLVRKSVGRPVPLLALVETAAGLQNVHLLAQCPGVVRLLFGTVDFCLDLRIDHDMPDGDLENVLAPYRAQIVLASCAAGLAPPVDGVTLDIRDAQRSLQHAQRAFRTGFGGKLCIHPSQIAAVHRGFEPDARRLEWARQVTEAAARYSGAFEFEGRMVDAPVLKRASELLGAQ
ncbi:MAG: CoA ester lyase [Acidovorax sp.]|uniref:HpcH/HpaI aldolase/citrate lyase family protein n=1 Tax=Acidovorax sp. TaxID=1872122 RepID=UPI002622E676|nr:CoA ester lyase [Acidovorax sp.]MDH4419123.1 CoA ester lyase [Acidovorax sp.]